MRTLSNDLNPVAALIERTTFRRALHARFRSQGQVEALGAEFTKRVRSCMAGHSRTNTHHWDVMTAGGPMAGISFT